MVLHYFVNSKYCVCMDNPDDLRYELRSVEREAGITLTFYGPCVLPRIRWKGVIHEARAMGEALRRRGATAARAALGLLTRVETVAGDEVEALHPTPELTPYPAAANVATTPPPPEAPNI